MRAFGTTAMVVVLAWSAALLGSVFATPGDQLWQSFTAAALIGLSAGFLGSRIEESR